MGVVLRALKASVGYEKVFPENSPYSTWNLFFG